MLLAQRIRDMVHFLHYYCCYGHLLSIIKSYNPEETGCNARSASWTIYQCKQQHWIEMLALPRQNTIMPQSGLLHRVHIYYDFCFNIECVAIEKWVKQKFSSLILLALITKYVRPYFQLLVDEWLI